jgi:hypothetical protein
MLLFALLFTTPASAQSSGGLVDATCLGDVTLNFNPGLTLFPQTTQLTGGNSTNSVGNCVFLGNGSTHTAEIVNVQGNGPLSCTVNGLVTGTAQLNWDDGTTSLANWTTLQVNGLNVPSIPRVFIMQGTVQSGKFAGDSMVLSYNDIPNLNYLDCLTAGLTSISGPTVATFTAPSL